MKRLGFMFPGQGSQAVGMLDVWGDHPVVRETLSEASDALGQDIGQLIHAATPQELALTTNTQPVMLVAGVAHYRVWIAETGIVPVVMAGHSLGEYSALVASGVISLAQAAPLVRFRAQAMQNAVPVGEGAMAAILGLQASQVQAVCQQVQDELPKGQVVEAVNFNDPMQTVIAGSKEAVEKACEAMKAAGAKRALILPVSAPFHSSLMRPAAIALEQYLEPLAFNSPSIPVIHNIDAELCVSAVEIKRALVRQAAGPVRWVECVQKMSEQKIEGLIECGPGKVLAGMAKRIVSDTLITCIDSPLALNELKEVCL